GIPGLIWFYACVATGAMPHAKTRADLRFFNYWTIAKVTAATNFTFTLDAPAKDVPYYVGWAFYPRPLPETRWTRFRAGCYKFFIIHGMPGLARPFKPTL